MRYNTLGQLFEVSAYTLGGGGIGQVWGETSREEAVATVREPTTPALPCSIWPHCTATARPNG